MIVALRRRATLDRGALTAARNWDRIARDTRDRQGPPPGRARRGDVRPGDREGGGRRRCAARDRRPRRAARTDPLGRRGDRPGAGGRRPGRRRRYADRGRPVQRRAIRSGRPGRPDRHLPPPEDRAADPSRRRATPARSWSPRSASRPRPTVAEPPRAVASRAGARCCWSPSPRSRSSSGRRSLTSLLPDGGPGGRLPHAGGDRRPGRRDRLAAVADLPARPPGAAGPMTDRARPAAAPRPRIADRAASGGPGDRWPARPGTSSSSVAGSSAREPCSTRRRAGMRAALVEQDDIAPGTSSRSSRLIHGGLRYLEQFRFGLVREALAERSRLLDAGAAPRPDRAAALPDLRDPVSRRRRSTTPGLTLYDVLGARHDGGWHRRLSTGRDPRARADAAPARDCAAACSTTTGSRTTPATRWPSRGPRSRPARIARDAGPGDRASGPTPRPARSRRCGAGPARPAPTSRSRRAPWSTRPGSGRPSRTTRSAAARCGSCRAAAPTSSCRATGSRTRSG